MIKRIAFTLLILMGAFTMTAQDITGPWYGKLEISGSPLRLVLHIEQSESGYTSTLDSPDQGSTGIPVDTTTFEGSKLDIAITALGLTYSSKLSGGTFNGTFTQTGFSLPLEFSREPIRASDLNRPQEPKEPFPYYSEEVKFQNADAGITLAGTLTLPKETGKFPVAVMISGSGPQNRDEELAGHKPFLVIADHLTRSGIGVLRFDDRGTVESIGDFEAATSADFASDAQSAVTYLRTRRRVWAYAAKVLEKVTCPVLAINGGNDLQVPAEENLSAIGNALQKAGNEDVTFET